MGIATAIAVGFVPEFVKFRQFEVAVILCEYAASLTCFVLISSGLGSACLGDILITVTLVMHLVRQRNPSSAVALSPPYRGPKRPDSQRRILKSIALSGVSL
jgi:hypothetical protein